MPTRAMGQALGKLSHNLRNPRWYAQQIGETAMSIWVLNPLGKKVVSYLRGHWLHENQNHAVADVYQCDDGHLYANIGGKLYRYDNSSDNWYHAQAT
ncbi:hypothetical protein HZF05_16445 [Sphingomonas sp. CGMCC 1.13654]|uniref:Uncharacterized protein n=1 Tax=Sphingomonas chungangi TaxID=2683589 RepID=A0A838L907_9SPHN|nr:hypothetical protein [Sphingomonas chungangi]MBA2935674.1 hypothetical protein [Sphingomonas chungangi]MVW54364.1 hypothetical protein [Sphingomonas chungangi]